MKNITKFEQDIIVLEQAHCEMLESQLADFVKLTDESMDIFSPLLDGSVDPGDVEAVTNKYWDRFGAMSIEWAKKEIEIRLRFREFYEYLVNAPKEEWEIYAKSELRSGIKWMARVQQLSKQLSSKKDENPASDKGA